MCESDKPDHNIRIQSLSDMQTLAFDLSLHIR